MGQRGAWVDSRTRKGEWLVQEHRVNWREQQTEQRFADSQGSLPPIAVLKVPHPQRSSAGSAGGLRTGSGVRLLGPNLGSAPYTVALVILHILSKLQFPYL